VKSYWIGLNLFETVIFVYVNIIFDFYLNVCILMDKCHKWLKFQKFLVTSQEV